MKTDVGDVPAKLPKKRQALKRWPDLWIAVWLDRDDLDEHERERLEAEKASRKVSAPPVLGWIVAREGLTPPQRRRAEELRAEYGPDVREVFLGTKGGGAQATVRESTIVLAFPKEMSRNLGSPVWEAVRYARHRKVPVRVVLPNGEEWDALADRV